MNERDICDFTEDAFYCILPQGHPGEHGGYLDPAADEPDNYENAPVRDLSDLRAEGLLP